MKFGNTILSLHIMSNCLYNIVNILLKFHSRTIINIMMNIMFEVLIYFCKSLVVEALGSCNECLDAENYS